MTSEAALAGIEAYGLGWKRRVTLRLPEDIPSLFENCEAPLDKINLAHEIASNLIKDLKETRLNRDTIRNFANNLELNLVLSPEDAEDLKQLSEDELEDLAEPLLDNLLYELNRLYDYADYNRILIVTI